MPILHKLKKLTAGAIAVLCLLSTVVIFAPDAAAVAPTYNVSSQYKQTNYYNPLVDYKLTGDERFDVVSIAMTQYGYHEGNSEDDMDGANLDGHKNFAEYNRMYGR